MTIKLGYTGRRNLHIKTKYHIKIDRLLIGKF